MVPSMNQAVGKLRYGFGENWLSFLRTVNSSRIAKAQDSLAELLQKRDLHDHSFLDAGCGSGIFSLAAKRMGASVYSFDLDTKCVACANELKRRQFPNDGSWQISEGSILDDRFVSSLGKFDIVYSWGVLHHTGDMAKAFGNVVAPVKDGGRLAIAIYNDQGPISVLWRNVKRLFCSGRVGRYAVTALFIPYCVFQGIAIGLLKFHNPMGQFADYRKRRGMSIIHDWFDWIGGYPFEVAKPEEVIHHFMRAGFTLEHLITTNWLGCNQYVFRKTTCTSSGVEIR